MVSAKKTLDAVTLLLSDARGIYIPRDFVQSFDLAQWENISAEDIAGCADPDSELYWDCWASILDNATYTPALSLFTRENNVWRLHQNGDLWAICYELMSDEEKENFEFED